MWSPSACIGALGSAPRNATVHLEITIYIYASAAYSEERCVRVLLFSERNIEELALQIKGGVIIQRMEARKLT